MESIAWWVPILFLDFTSPCKLSMTNDPLWNFVHFAFISALQAFSPGDKLFSLTVFNKFPRKKFHVDFISRELLIFKCN